MAGWSGWSRVRWCAGVLASDTTKARLQCGTLTYWVVVLSVAPFILMLAAGVRAYLLRKYRVKARYGWEWTEGDVQWTERATIIYPAVCSLAGLVAGLFGIGGGVIKVGTGDVATCRLQCATFSFAPNHFDGRGSSILFEGCFCPRPTSHGLSSMRLTLACQ